jgi:hypothetical protein
MNEQSCEIGVDKAWVFQLGCEIRNTPLASSLMDSLRPLAALGVDMKKLEFVMDETRAEYQQKLTSLGIADIYR